MPADIVNQLQAARHNVGHFQVKILPNYDFRKFEHSSSREYKLI
jgi:hypothetical protein